MNHMASVWSARCGAKRENEDNGREPRPTGIHPTTTAIHAIGQQNPPTRVITQRRLSKTASWMELTEARHAQEALDHIQESNDPPPTEWEDTALILILTIRSWTWNHTVALHDKTSPPYACIATCRRATASAGEVHLDWTPGRGNEEYNVAHTLSHGNVQTEEEDPEQTETQPPRQTPLQRTLYKLLAHAWTLAEHSIQPYTDVTYVRRMLQDWPKYGTEVLEGHTQPPATTPRTTWDNLVPDGDISALPKVIQNKAPKHPFDDSFDPAIVNAILAYHSWTTQQHLNLHSASDDPREWHPIGAPALEVYLNEDAAKGVHTITDLRPATPQPIPELYIPPSLPRPPPPTRDDPSLREHHLPSQKDVEPTTTVQHMPKPLNTHHVPDNYQLPRARNYTRGITPDWRLPTGTVDWKQMLPWVVTVEVIHLIATKQIKLPPAEHLFITIQGWATIEGATLGDGDRMPQARPTQAIWVTTTTDADIAIDPHSEWAAIHYTVEGAERGPKTNNWRQRWTAEVQHLSHVVLHDTLTPETMEPAKRAIQMYLSTAKHTVWHYLTNVHPEAVSQIEVTLTLDLPDTHSAHQTGEFTTYWSF